MKKVELPIKVLIVLDGKDGKLDIQRLVVKYGINLTEYPDIPESKTVGVVVLSDDDRAELVKLFKRTIIPNLKGDTKHIKIGG